MNALSVLCTEDNLQDDIAMSKDVDMQASYPFGKVDYTLHKTRLFHEILMQKIDSSGYGKF